MNIITWQSPFPSPFIKCTFVLNLWSWLWMCRAKKNKFTWKVPLKICGNIQWHEILNELCIMPHTIHVLFKMKVQMHVTIGTCWCPHENNFDFSFNLWQECHFVHLCYFKAYVFLVLLLYGQRRNSLLINSVTVYKVNKFCCDVSGCQKYECNVKSLVLYFVEQVQLISYHSFL